MLETEYLLPLTVLFLGLALIALAFRARRRRGYFPLSLGVMAALALVGGKFVLDWDPAVYAGIAALVGASLWNSWPVRPAAGVPSAPAETLYRIGSIAKEK